MSGGLDYSRVRNQNLDALIKLENKDERSCVSEDMKALKRVLQHVLSEQLCKDNRSGYGSNRAKHPNKLMKQTVRLSNG